MGIKLVIPSRIQGISPIDAFPIAADFNHLWPIDKIFTIWMFCFFGDATQLNFSCQNRIEWICIAPLAILTILFGVAPNLIFNITEGSALRILNLMAGG